MEIRASTLRLQYSNKTHRQKNGLKTVIIKLAKIKKMTSWGNHDQGMTLLELLIALLITGILTSIALVTFFSTIKKSCWNESCADLDPIDQNCHKDATTVIEEDFDDINVELRHSFKCQASWARSTAPDGSTIYVEDSNGKRYGNYEVVPDPYIRHYTNMSPGLIMRKACAKLPNGQEQCTEFVN